MRHIFIADAHLRNPEDENYRKLLTFLDSLPGNTDTLFILGDLFEFWIGYRKNAFPHYEPLLDRLQELRRHGVNIVYFEGNHDFHLGPVFQETLQAEIHSVPAVVELDGKRVYLCHGDEINRSDYRYRMLRLVLHSPLTRMLTYVVPPFVASAIASGMGRASRENHGSRRMKWDFGAIVRQFAAAQFAAGCDAVITGHFHLPFIEKAPDDRVLLSLGDWISQFSYGEWQDGGLTLHRFQPSD